jgi:8-oxo-dGTP pyrophosphatase MutT (NUDIX family)
MTSAYVSTGVAANAVGVASTTLQRWAHAGLVTPALRTPGGHFRWDLADLRKQLNANTPSDIGEPMPEPSSAPVKQPVVAAIVTSELGLLITKRRDGVPPYGFLTGEIEPGESPADAAVRECKEEAALAIESGAAIAERIHPKTGRRMYYMAAEPTHGTRVSVNDDEELAEVRWVSLAEADELTADYGGIYPPVHDYLERKLGAA